MGVTFWPHYEVQASIKSIDDLKTLFPNGKANDLNWVFYSMSGVHGTYTTLDEIDAGEPDDDPEENLAPYQSELTVLVVHPRLVVLKYGNIRVHDKAEADWLRELVASSLAAVIKTQEGNLPSDK
jgi:hypothetical protein